MTLSCHATPIALNEWFAAFGLGDKPEDTEDTDIADTSDDTFFGQEDGLEISPVRRSSHACDPTKCRMLHGVCCDCCKCLHHCKCGDLKVLPPSCDTPDCSERVCPQCMRCHSHCQCRSTSVRTEHDGYYLVSSPTTSPTASVSSSSKLQSSQERIAPPPLSDDGTAQRFSRDRSSLVSYDDDYDHHGNAVDWMGHNTRVMTSDGTVATLTSHKTMRVDKSKFEVVYDKNYTCKSKCSPNRPSFVAAYSRHGVKESIRSRRAKNGNLGHTKGQPLPKSWHLRTRPRGAAAMAEF